MKKLPIFVVFLLVFSLFFSIPLVERVSAVSPVYVWGSGYHSWFDSSHVATLSEAITNVTAGGTVYIWSGTYLESVTVSKSVSFIGNGTNYVRVSDPADYVFTLTANATSFSGINFTMNGGGGIYAPAFQKDVMIKNCSFVNTTWEGIYFWAGTTNVTIQDCFFYNITAGGEGIYLFDFSFPFTLNNITVRRNTVSSCETGFFIVNGDNDIDIYDNIVYTTGYINLILTANGALVYNNYFMDGINFVASVTNTSFNISKTYGTNILGGSYKGGNFWNDSSSYDSNGDGFLDTPFFIPGGYYDYLPLAIGYNSGFEVNYPSYLEVGQYLTSMGSIRNITGSPINNIWVYTEIRYSNDTLAPYSNMSFYSTSGFYFYSFSTTTLIPGIYYIRTSFFQSPYNYNSNKTLYLSVDPGSGTHVSTLAHFNFYNSGTGEGLLPEQFKLYVTNTLPIVNATDRNYGMIYSTYTGEVIHYRVDDYFNNKLYPTTFSYANVTITSLEQSIDIPIGWVSFSVKNMNHSIVKLKITNSSRNITQYLFPYEAYYWKLLPATYNLTMDYYDSETGAFEETKYADVVATTDTYYWIRGYDLQDIIIEVQLTNTSLDNLIVSVTTNINITNSSVNNIITKFMANISVMESNITNLVNIIESSVGLVNSTINSINSTIWSNLTFINSTLDTVNNKFAIYFNMMNVTLQYLNNSILANITILNSTIGNINFSILSNISIIGSTLSNMSYVMIQAWSSSNNSFSWLNNKSIVTLSFYNTNEGLGLPENTLQVYINGTRYKETTYYVTNGTYLNLTIKDYYNFTMYNHTFHILAPYTFIDLGLTFHSYKFSNKNDDYYMISFLRNGSTRWFERGVGPHETVEYLLPSGNYTLRIYDRYNNTLYNHSITMNNSKFFVINGTNLTLVISGLSVIYGQLLELAGDFSSYTTPDIVRVAYNIPSVYTVFDRIGARLGTVLICPALVITATTINSSFINFSTPKTLYPLIPNGSISANGTVNVISGDDTITFTGGDIKWVNVSWPGSGNYSNTTYIPGSITCNGNTYTVRCSGNLTVTRSTRFQQSWKFYWTKTLDTNFYEATVNVTNHINTTLYMVTVSIEFANDTTADLHTVLCYDVTNGVYLVSGTQFLAAGTAIQFMIPTMSPWEVRAFRGEYYATTVAPTPSNAVVIINEMPVFKEWKDKQYYYLTSTWINPSSKSFVGTLDIQFNFDTNIDGVEHTIAPQSIEVFDITNNRLLDRDEFSYHGGGITINQGVVGTVSSGSSRSFGIYFLFTEEDVATVSTDFINTKLINVFGYDITVLTLIIIGCIAAVAIFASRESLQRKRKLNRDNITWILIAVFVLSLVFIYLTNI